MSTSINPMEEYLEMFHLQVTYIATADPIQGQGSVIFHFKVIHSITARRRKFSIHELKLSTTR